VTALAHAQPEQVLRAGALLGATADQLGVAVAACRRSAAVTWVGRAQEQYQQRLDRLASDLVGVQAAFDSACDALLGYGQALAYAQPLAEEADRLAALGDETVLARVPALRWEADQAELAAAARLIVALDELTLRAPHRGAWTAAQHDAANFATGMADYVKGLGETLADVVSSLPGVGSADDRSKARHALGEQAVDALQPWKQVQELITAIQNGMGFRAAGGVAMAVVLRRPGLKETRDIRLFGTHDEMTAAMLTAMRPGALPGDALLDAVAAKRVQEGLLAEFKRLKRRKLPPVSQLLDEGVDLRHHETKPGHLMIRHIGRDVDFLLRRQREDAVVRGYPSRVGTFDTLDQAEALVDDVLRANARAVRRFEVGTAVKLELDGPLADPVGLLINKRGQLMPATSLRVVLVKVDRVVCVRTAYLR